MARTSTWDGEERRSGTDRRDEIDRRSVSRDIWERRSGFDRRGHKLYSALNVMRSKTAEEEPERLSNTG